MSELRGLLFVCIIIYTTRLIFHPAFLFVFPTFIYQDDALFVFRCCHLKYISTASLPPVTQRSREMTTSISFIIFLVKQETDYDLYLE